MKFPRLFQLFLILLLLASCFSETVGSSSQTSEDEAASLTETTPTSETTADTSSSSSSLSSQTSSSLSTTSDTIPSQEVSIAPQAENENQGQQLNSQTEQTDAQQPLIADQTQLQKLQSQEGAQTQDSSTVSEITKTAQDDVKEILVLIEDLTLKLREKINCSISQAVVDNIYSEISKPSFLTDEIQSGSSSFSEAPIATQTDANAYNSVAAAAVQRAVLVARKKIKQSELAAKKSLLQILLTDYKFTCGTSPSPQLVIALKRQKQLHKQILKAAKAKVKASKTTSTEPSRDVSGNTIPQPNAAKAKNKQNKNKEGKKNKKSNKKEKTKKR